MAGRIVFLGLGAALMYLMDPQAGRKRRTDLRNQVEATSRKVQRGKEMVVRDATNRAQGAIHETRKFLQTTRQKVEDGTILDVDASALRQCMTGFMGGVMGPWGKSHWSPAERALAGSVGAGLAVGGYARGGLKGIVMFLLGSGLLARAATNRDIASLARGEAIPVQKTIRIAKPVAEVYAYWRNLENFPMWMSHVIELRYVGGDRYHWKVEGPAGVPVEWDAELLNVVENREMTWRSVEGSTVQNTGRVRFEEDGDGTRVHVLIKYQPPGGIIGHAVAKAFGSDPASEMDDDLAKLKSLIETGQLPRGTAMERRLDGGASGLGAAAD
jgi:uncharacterized membrane protein